MAEPPNRVPAFDAPAAAVDPNRLEACVVAVVDVPNSVPAEGAVDEVVPKREGLAEPNCPPN